MKGPGAAAVIIGNEVLSGKVQDLNGPLLIRRLAEQGIPLKRISIVPDEIDAIVEAIDRARRVAKEVISSGGIGPTHDDVTVRAVALALGRRVVRSEAILGWIEARFGKNVTPQTLRLSEVPEGSELIPQAVGYPIIACAGMYLLPGVPQLFAHQLETILPRLTAAPKRQRTLYLSIGESQIAAVLDRVALSMPEVLIGSYPQFGPTEIKVKVTVESELMGLVEQATSRLIAELPPGSILRTE